MTGALLLVALASTPAYTRPADPATDLARLRQEVADGVATAEPWRQSLQTYLAMGELQTIPELIDLLAASFPREPSFQEARMMFASLSGRHAEALALGERVLADFPDYPTILTNLGRAYIAADQPARGVNLLLGAVEQGPIRTEDWALLLATLGVTGPQPEAAVARLREKVAANPQRPGLRYALVVALVRTGQYEAARGLLLETPTLANHPELQIFLDHAAPDNQPRGTP